jgi:hypothetical protein
MIPARQMTTVRRKTNRDFGPFKKKGDKGKWLASTTSNNTAQGTPYIKVLARTPRTLTPRRRKSQGKGSGDEAAGAPGKGSPWGGGGVWAVPPSWPAGFRVFTCGQPYAEHP